MDEIRRATNGNFALGSERFAARVAEVIGRRAIPGQSGRPRKSVEPQSGELFLGNRGLSPVFRGLSPVFRRGFPVPGFPSTRPPPRSSVSSSRPAPLPSTLIKPASTKLARAHASPRSAAAGASPASRLRQRSKLDLLKPSRSQNCRMLRPLAPKRSNTARHSSRLRRRHLLLSADAFTADPVVVEHGEDCSPIAMPREGRRSVSGYATGTWSPPKTRSKRPTTRPDARRSAREVLVCETGATN